MTFEVVIHKAEEGGYWAEIPAIPGCATQGETLEEVDRNIKEAAADACWMKAKMREAVSWYSLLIRRAQVPPVKPITGTDLVRVLQRNEWELVRVHGEHHIFGKLGSNVRVSIPIHGNTALKIGLLNRLLKSAGLSESDL